MNKQPIVISLIGGIIVGISLMAYIPQFFHTATIINTTCLKDFPFTSRTLDCAQYDSSAARLQALGALFDQAVIRYVQQGKATRVSVWVRDLETKQWAAGNENEKYAPASLLKLPLAIAYYKLAQVQPSILDNQLVLATSTSQSGDAMQDILPASLLQTGQQYSVEKLLEEMVINSDNNAAGTLLANIDQNLFEATLLDLGIKVPGTNRDHDFMTAQTYGAIFRTLYNASYLNRDYSEKVLELMSKSAFKGIADPLPEKTKVAHKFGEREVDNAQGVSQSRELHDCGIVYKDPNPYSICIMTEGTSFDDLKDVITDLSKITYEHI